MPVEAESPQPTPAPDAPRGRDGRQPATSQRSRIVRPLVALVVVAALVVAAIVVFAGGDDKKSGTVRRAPAVAASLAQLDAVATSAGHPVYWAGAQPGTTYELTQTRDGRIFIRYLPAGTEVGSPRASYLSVGTYPQRDALATLTATARAQAVATIALAGGGRAFQDTNRPTSAYAAYPGADVQVEVFDKTPGHALELVRSGRITPLGRHATRGAAPKAASVQELKALGVQLGHPIYWAGAASGTTYELTQTSDGRVYVRYLPAGVPVGSSDPDYLTVGTYPQQDAFATLKATAARRGADTMDIAGGGLAYVDRDFPDSVYLSYPTSDVQIEVYDPTGARARQLVTSGKIAAVR
jgi:hypothetical protein